MDNAIVSFVLKNRNVGSVNLLRTMSEEKMNRRNRTYLQKMVRKRSVNVGCFKLRTRARGARYDFLGI